MLLLFHHWNNTAEEDDHTIADDKEGVSTLHHTNNEADGSKGNNIESSSDEIW